MVENPNMGCGGPCTSNPLKCKRPCDFEEAFINLVNQSPIAKQILERSKRGIVHFKAEVVPDKEKLLQSGSIKFNHPETPANQSVLEPAA